MLYIKIKQIRFLRSPVYTGSSSHILMDYFDSEGYLRPRTDSDSIYDEVV